MDVAYTCICVCELVKIAKDIKGWTPWVVIAADCKGFEAQ